MAIVLIDKLLIGCLVGIVLLVVGFWINKRLRIIEWQQAIRREVLLAEHKAAMDQLAAQIRELYSPLYGMIEQSQRIFYIVKTKLPGFAATGTPQGEWESKIWRYFVEK